MIEPFLIDRLKTIPIEMVAEDLGLKEKLGLHQSGRGISGNCIEGHSSESGQCFSLWRDGNQFHCFSCGLFFDAIDLVQRERGLEFHGALQYLAEKYRPDLMSEIQKSNFNIPEKPKSFSTEMLYEIIFDLGKELLIKKEGKEAYSYLVEKRGYDPEKLLETEWIYWPKDSEIRTSLKCRLPPERHHEADEIKLNGIGGDLFRVALPYRNRFGKITGFAKRATVKEGLEVDIGGKKKTLRWSYTSGLDKGDLYGLSRCKYLKDRTIPLMLVEGLPDATYLPALGMENIVATGQGELSLSHIEGLKIYGITFVVVVFDNDKKNSKGEVPSLEKATKAAAQLEKHGIKAFVMPPWAFDSVKDPEEYVLKNGIESFTNLILENALSRSRWLPVYWSTKNDLATDIGRHSAIGQITKEYTSFKTPLEKQECIGSMMAVFNLSQLEVEGEFDRAKIREEQRQSDEKQKKASKEAQSLIAQGNFEQASLIIRDLGKELKKTSIPIIKTADQYHAENETHLEKYRGKEFIGLPQKRLPTVDKITLGLRGLNLLAAPPNVGKTALTIQLMVDILEQNPDACVLYLSLEMPINSVISRIRCNLSEMDWETLVLGTNRKPSENNLFSPEDWQKLEAGNKKFKKLGKRLQVFSKDCGLEFKTNSILSVINQLKTETLCNRVLVVVDYLQVLPIPDNEMVKINTDLVADKWRIGELLKLSHVLGEDPLISISETRKPGSGAGEQWGGDLSDVMGSARATYSPDVVWLYRSILNKNGINAILELKKNEEKKDEETIRKYFDAQGCDIQQLSLIKGRDGTKKGSLFLKFHYRQNRFQEVSSDHLKQEFENILRQSKNYTKLSIPFNERGEQEESYDSSSQGKSLGRVR